MLQADQGQAQQEVCQMLWGQLSGIVAVTAYSPPLFDGCLDQELPRRSSTCQMQQAPPHTATCLAGVSGEALVSDEQLLDDDVEMVTKEDPMLSGFASSDKSKVKRTLSTESLDSERGSPDYYQKSKKSQKTEKKNIRKVKRRVSSQNQNVLEIQNSPRIPVVSRPVFSKSRLVSSPSAPAANIIFPLPKEKFHSIRITKFANG